MATTKHYREQQSASTTYWKFSKRDGRVSLKIQYTRRVLIPLFSQTMLTVQTVQEWLVLVTSKHQTWRSVACSVARRIQHIKHNVLFRVIVASFTGAKKSLKILDNCGGRRDNKLYVGHEKNDRRHVRSKETLKHETERCRRISKKNQGLSFLDMNANYYDKIRKMWALFTNICSK